MSNLIVALLAIAFAVATTFVFKLPPDNPIEEIAEEVVEEETGINLDFTPSTTEKNK